MLHLDLPTRAQVDRLLTSNHSASVSIYLRTDPASHGDAERIEFRSLGTAAVEQLVAAGVAKAEIALIEEHLAVVVDDDELWTNLARSLAIFTDPVETAVFRLANRLDSQVEVSDRYHLKPLMRAITFPQAAYVLAIAQHSWRLVRVMADGHVVDVTPSGAPDDVAEAASPLTGRGKAPRGSGAGAEMDKARMRQYAMQVDRAIRPVLGGTSLPLILAGTEPLISIYRSVNHHPHLADDFIHGNAEHVGNDHLADEVRPILDRIYAAEVNAENDRFERLRGAQLAITDLADIARAATLGLVDTIYVDVDSTVHGTVDEAGSITITDGASATTYGVADEAARRTWTFGGRVFALHAGEVPGGGEVSAILRYVP